MLKPIITAAALLIASAILSPLAAQSALEDACKARNVGLDERLAGRTAMIDAARETGRSLAAAYCNRGFVLTEKRDLDRALTDLDKAIESDPSYPCSFSNRGRVFALKGDFN